MIKDDEIRKIVRDATYFEEAIAVLQEFGAQSDAKVVIMPMSVWWRVTDTPQRWHRDFVTFSEALTYFMTVLTGKETPA